MAGIEVRAGGVASMQVLLAPTLLSGAGRSGHRGVRAESAAGKSASRITLLLNRVLYGAK